MLTLEDSFCKQVPPKLEATAIIIVMLQNVPGKYICILFILFYFSFFILCFIHLIVAYEWSAYVKKRTNEILQQVIENRAQSRVEDTRESLDQARRTLADSWSFLKKSNSRNNNNQQSEFFYYEED